MAVRSAAQLKAAAQALLTDAGPDYDIDPSEVRALVVNIVDSVPSLGLTAAQATDLAGALLATLAQFNYDPATDALALDLSAYAPLAGATFSGAVKGPAPAAPADLATKAYIDSAAAALSAAAGIVPVGNLWHATAAGDGNLQDTGIALPSGPDDDEVYLFAAAWAGGSPVLRPWLGSAIKALPAGAAGAAHSTGSALSHEAAGATALKAARSASGALLLGNDNDAWSAADFFALYEFATGAPAGSPYITEFALTGELDPAAGDIGGNRYAYQLAIAHSGQVSAARITGFAGAAPSGPATLLATLDADDFHAASGSFALPGTINLAAGSFYTVRLEVYASGQVPGTNSPATQQDRRITAHAAAAAAYHWGRVPVDSDDADAAATAARVAFADHDTETSSELASQYSVSLPNDSTSYQSYLFAKAGQPQPAGFTSAGLDASNSWHAAVDITVGGTAYKAYILKALFAATYAEDNGRIWGIRS